jgi:hypothetical protein
VVASRKELDGESGNEAGTTMPITLPGEPTGEQFEDLVVAGLRALGYFTEQHLVLRAEQTEILELDVVATPLDGALSDRTLFEAKKDGFRFAVVFKVYGQRSYLTIPSACIVSFTDCEVTARSAYEARGAEMNVRLVAMSELGDIEKLAPTRNGLTGNERKAVAAIGWYQQIARRLAQAVFLQRCRSERGRDAVDHAREYHLTCQESFFQPDALARAKMLYEAYLNHPKLTGELVKALAESRKVAERSVWNELNDSEEHLWLQYLMMIEHTARIAVIKHAFDDAMNPGSRPVRQLRIGKRVLTISPEDFLPPRFLEGVALLKMHPHGARLPFLFQVFVELFGGFLFFKDAEELTLVEKVTGIPAGEVLDCLDVLDKFFAPEGNTFFYKQCDVLLCLKMVPGVTRGAGAFLRQTMYDLKEYETRFPVQGFLLAKWHNALYRTLEPTLKAEANS